jgi:hypothetical protein
MSATAGKVALVKNNTLLQGVCPTGGGIVDFVGFGSTNCFEGVGGTPSPSNTTSVQRGNGGCGDRDDNTVDFAAGSILVRNSSFVANTCLCNVVNESDLGGEMDSCQVLSPASLSVTTGATTPAVTGEVDEGTLTSSPSWSQKIRAQVGYGVLTTNPQYDATWLWFNAAFTIQSGTADDFATTFTAPAVGSKWGYVFRFTQDGQNWTYCDLDGAGSSSGKTFDLSQIAPMTVNP